MQNTYDLDSEYAIGILDVPHKVTIAPIVQLPFGPGKRWAQTGAAAWLLGDWTISSIIAFESGFPISVSMDSQNTQAFTRVQRANPGTGEAETSGDRSDRFRPEGDWLNASAFSQPAAFTLGTLPRTLDDVRTPHRNNWDFVASKGLRLSSTVRAQIRLEVLNITNTVKVRGPETGLGSSTFGQISDQSGFMRLTQLMFRVLF
jgi:hypothetical protein